MLVLTISSTLIVLRCTGSEDIILDLAKQEDRKRGAFGDMPQVALTLMCASREETAPICVGPT